VRVEPPETAGFDGRAAPPAGFSLKEAAMLDVMEKLRSGDTRDQPASAVYQAVCSVFARTASLRQAKMTELFYALLDVLLQEYATSAEAPSAGAMEALVGVVLPPLLGAACEGKASAREAAHARILLLLKSSFLHDAVAVLGPCLEPLKPSAAPKLCVGRLQLLAALIQCFGLGKGKGGPGNATGSPVKHGLPLGDLMAVVQPLMGHARAEVRTEAVAVAVLCFQQQPAEMERFLGKGAAGKAQLEALRSASQTAAKPKAKEVAS
jgi:hypothetical protein